MKRIVAVPVQEGLLCSHFGHCSEFVILKVEDKKIVSEESIPAPPHQPGLLPKWLAERGVTEVIAGGIGQSAVNLLEEQKINVSSGAAVKSAKELANDWINGLLQLSTNSCNH